jgi:hypothetical protein
VAASRRGCIPRARSKDRVWIAPEIPLPSLASDWLQGRDAARDAILSIVTAAPN